MSDNINTKHESEILRVIKDHKLVRFDHIFSFYKGCSRATAYNHNLDKLDTIKYALEENRVTGVNYLLQKWMKSDSSTLQIAAMRLICDTDEHRRLNQSYIDHTTGGDKLDNRPTIVFRDGQDNTKS